MLHTRRKSHQNINFSNLSRFEIPLCVSFSLFETLEGITEKLGITKIDCLEDKVNFILLYLDLEGIG